MTPKHEHREVWLQEAMTAFIRPLFQTKGYTVPDNVRIGVGWPSRGALSAKKRRIGEAWSNLCSADKSHEIILSLCLDDPSRVLGVLIHEVIHVTIGVEHGHKKPFADAGTKLGLIKPWTATTESPELQEQLRRWIGVLGAYPHAKLDGLAAKKKEATRMLLLECACGLKIRSTQTWLDTYGNKWPCPCGGNLVHDDGEGEPLDEDEEENEDD